jgi:hypothetical protein
MFSWSAQDLLCLAKHETQSQKYVIFSTLCCRNITFLSTDLVQHLQNNFPEMFKLYTTLSNRKTAATPFEILIATNSTAVGEKEAADYLKSLDITSQSTIKSAFDQQTAVRSFFHITDYAYRYSRPYGTNPSLKSSS